MSSYLLNRNGHYHVRIRIPSDLTSVIPAVVLVKSQRKKRGLPLKKENSIFKARLCYLHISCTALGVSLKGILGIATLQFFPSAL